MSHRNSTTDGFGMGLSLTWNAQVQSDMIPAVNYQKSVSLASLLFVSSPFGLTSSTLTPPHALYAALAF